MSQEQATYIWLVNELGLALKPQSIIKNQTDLMGRGRFNLE
jgi:hypothetical protein